MKWQLWIAQQNFFKSGSIFVKKKVACKNVLLMSALAWTQEISWQWMSEGFCVLSRTGKERHFSHNSGEESPLTPAASSWSLKASCWCQSGRKQTIVASLGVQQSPGQTSFPPWSSCEQQSSPPQPWTTGTDCIQCRLATCICPLHYHVGVTTLLRHVSIA